MVAPFEGRAYLPHYRCWDVWGADYSDEEEFDFKGRYVYTTSIEQQQHQQEAIQTHSVDRYLPLEHWDQEV